MSFLKLVVSFAGATVSVLGFHMAWLLMTHLLLPEWACHALSYAALVGAAAFTSWYPGHLRKRVASQHDIPAEAR